MAIPPSSEAASPPPQVIGVLGGIASGKSAAARLIAGADGVVADADAIAAEVLASPEGVERLRADFGPEVLGPDGQPDRAALARLVFADAGARARLEGWIHPRVRERISELLESARARGVSRVVLDVPLLLENDAEHGLVARCHALVFVDAPLHERERRAAERRGWAAGEVARREAAQLPLDDKQRRATRVIQNDGSIGDLERSVRALMSELDAP